MKKLNDKGFSLVEIIVAVAIFVVLIIPVIKQLASGMSIASESKQKQQSVEYAEYIMEYFKSASLDDIGKDNLFDNANGFVETTTPTTGYKEQIVAANVDGVDFEYAKRTFAIPSSSPVTIGGSQNKYYSTVVVDTKDYALAALGYRPKTASDGASVPKYTVDGDEYVKDSSLNVKDPNKVNTVGLTNLDSSKVAIIAGSTANFDETASDAFFSIKAQMLKEKDEKKWMQLMYGDSGINDFSLDTTKKVTRITITRDTSSSDPTYYVSCQLEYEDLASNKFNFKADNQIYNVYSQTFVQDSVPDIYFMYNPCIYNAEYMPNDYIVLDTSGLGTENVNLYIVKTAAELPENIKEVIAADGTIEFTEANLVKDVISGGSHIARADVNTWFNVNGDINHMQVFTNIPLDKVNDYTVFVNVDTTKPANNKPASDATTHFVKTLADDVEYNGRLYSIRVKLYKSDGDLMAEFKGTRGAD